MACSYAYFVTVRPTDPKSNIHNWNNAWLYNYI